MAWHGMDLDLTLTIRGTVFPTVQFFKIFHTQIIYEKGLILHCGITVKAFCGSTITAFGCIERRATLWYTSPALIVIITKPNPFAIPSRINSSNHHLFLSIIGDILHDCLSFWVTSRMPWTA